MIGRFSRKKYLDKLLDIHEFYLVGLGVILIAFSYLGRLSHPESILGELLALAATFVLGGPIVWNAIKGLLDFQTNVDELVSLAIVASLLAGEFQAAAVVALVMILGSLLEKFTAERARSAIHALIKINPAQATLITSAGEVPVPIDEIQIGDRVLIRPGERVPVDGVVLRGGAAVNQSALTGESMPLDKEQGDSVYAGSVLYNGMLEVRAEKVGQNSTLGKLIKLVQEAESTRAPILRVADRYARYFTPFIIGLSLLVFLVSKDVNRSITILIVGCPCAFILAAPTAVTAALGNAARQGVLIKGGALLEELGSIDAVVFDKTGTLTTGKPCLEKVIPAGETPENILKLAASAERYSEHPIAKAILGAAQAASLTLSEPRNFHYIVGHGIEAEIDGQLIFVGAVHDNDPEHAYLKIDDHAGTVLMIKQAGKVIGCLAVSDKIRPDVRVLIEELERLGINRIALLTGDSFEAAAKVAQTAGIKEFYNTLLPEQKLDYIRDIQQHNHKVAMVGDGINDAPSLTAADIGIAMGAMGTDAAIAAADIALMNDDLSKIPYAIKLGQATLRTINFNIFFALIFNMLAIIGSGWGYLHPISGAIVHNIGSVLVVINSARLIRKSA